MIPDFNAETLFSLAREIPVNGLHLPQYLAAVEVFLIKQAMDRSNGVCSEAAKLLQINRTTLVEKRKKYGLMNNTNH